MNDTLKQSGNHGSPNKKGDRARSQGGQDRRLRGFIIGRDSFARISAVEGIHLTAEMKRDFREFDRKGLPAAERRRAILKKYGGKPA